MQGARSRCRLTRFDPSSSRLFADPDKFRALSTLEGTGYGGALMRSREFLIRASILPILIAGAAFPAPLCCADRRCASAPLCRAMSCCAVV